MKTGYEDWDQNLKTLGGALFPDPSKAAHAYYYGTEARNALLKGAQTQESLAAGHSLTGLLRGDPRAQVPTYGPGPLGVTIMQDPYAGGGAPAAASAGPAPMPSLSAAVAGRPDAVGNAIVAGVENHNQTGPVPPFSSPAPSAPPAPNATGSDGSVPQNGPGNVAPGSATSAGSGGRTYAPPATATGSPAPINLDFARVMDMGAKSGLNADQMQVLARSTLANMEASGKMPVPVAEELAALFGSPTMRTQAISNQGALAVGAQTQAGETARNTARIAGEMARQQVVTGEARRADEFAPEKTVDEAGNAIYVPRKDTPGKRAYDSTLANTVAGKQNEYADFIKPDDPTKTVPMTIARGAALGLQRAPVSTDAAGALLNTAILRTIDPAEKERLESERLRQASLPKGPVTGAQSFEQMAVNYAADQQAYPQPDPITAVDLTVKDPVALTPPAETAITDRVKALRRTTRGYVLNDTEARNEARRQLQDEGVLYTPDEINKMRADGIRSWVGRDVRIQNYTPPGGTPGPHMMVGLKPKDGAATTTTPISTVTPGAGTNRQINRSSTPGRPAVGATAPAATAAPAATPTAALPPGTVVGPANGAPEGKTGTVKETGQGIVVRGNSWVVQ